MSRELIVGGTWKLDNLSPTMPDSLWYSRFDNPMDRELMIKLLIVASSD